MRLFHLKLYLFILLIFSSITLKAQEISVGVGGGGGIFDMYSMKKFNQAIIIHLPFKPSLTDNFPPYYNYKAEVRYTFNDKMSIGVNCSATSTGSRLSLADYSGKYTFDNRQIGLFPGISVMLGKEHLKPIGLNLLMEAGVAISKMIATEKLKVYTDSSFEKMTLDALGVYINPGMSCFWNINSKIRLNANISYYLGIEKGYHLPNGKDKFVYNTESGEIIKPQWDGLRFGITAYWVFRKKIQKTNTPDN